MKIVIRDTKQIVKKTSRVSKIQSSDSKLLLEQTTSTVLAKGDKVILSIGDYGVFKVMYDNNEIKEIEGRVIEICNENVCGTPFLIFRMDSSTQYNSEIVDIWSTTIINWTKSGEETISIEDILNYCVYQDNRCIELDTGETKVIINLGDLVTITDKKTNTTKTGKIKSILQDQITIDCSAPGYSDVYIIESNDFESDSIALSL